MCEAINPSITTSSARKKPPVATMNESGMYVVGTPNVFVIHGSI
jgi:hypothetical protein